MSPGDRAPRVAVREDDHSERSSIIEFFERVFEAIRERRRLAGVVGTFVGAKEFGQPKVTPDPRIGRMMDLVATRFKEE